MVDNKRSAKVATEKFQSLDAHGVINTNSVSWNLRRVASEASARVDPPSRAFLELPEHFRRHRPLRAGTAQPVADVATTRVVCVDGDGDGGDAGGEDTSGEDGEDDSGSDDTGSDDSGSDDSGSSGSGSSGSGSGSSGSGSGGSGSGGSGSGGSGSGTGWRR